MTKDKEASIEILKTFAWPFVALFSIVLFSFPIYKTLNELPDLIASSDAISIGNFSLRVDKSLANNVDEDVRNTLGELDNDDVFALLIGQTAIPKNLVPSTSYSFNKSIDFNDQLGMQDPVMLSLVQKGIYIQDGTDKDDIDPTLIHVKYTMSPRGLKVRMFLLRIVRKIQDEVGSQ